MQLVVIAAAQWFLYYDVVYDFFLSKNSQEYLARVRDQITLKRTLLVCEIKELSREPCVCARSKNSQENLACVRDQRTLKRTLLV